MDGESAARRYKPITVPQLNQAIADQKARKKRRSRIINALKKYSTPPRSPPRAHA